MSLGITVLLATCIVNIFLGSFVLMRNTYSRLGQSFFVMTLFISAWAASNYLADHAAQLSLNILFNKLSYLLAFLALVSACLFSYYFSSNVSKKPSKLLSAGGIIMVPAVSIFSLSSYVAGSVHQTTDGLQFTVGKLLPVYILCLLVFLAYILKNVLLMMERGTNIQKNQAKIIGVSFAISIVIALITNALIPSLSSDWQTAKLGPPILSLLVVASLSYAIVRHKLFDIRFFVVRAVAYFFTFFVLSVVYVLPTIFITTKLIDAPLKIPALVTLALVSLFIAFVFQPLRKYFDEATGRLFFRDYYEPQDVLDKISDVLVGNASVQDIEIQSATIIMDALKPTHLSFLLQNDKSPERQDLLSELTKTRQEIIDADNLNQNLYSNLHERMHAEDIAQAVRLQTPHGILGFILFGYKKSGGKYSHVDNKLLAIAADDVAVGLQNALRFEQISQFNLTLKQKIQEATAELQQANTHLQALDVIKDEFISMATHQLGTPLTVIDGYLSMVLDDPAEKDAKNAVYLKQALHRVRLMKRLVADFLNVSRIDAGRFMIERSETDLNKVVPEEMEQLTQKAREKGVTLEYVAPNQPVPLVNIDEQKTRQAIMNLIDNAVFYSPKGHVKVYLDRDQQNLIFKVVDDGIGVPENQKAKLFTKFTRADNAKRQRPDGTGIGLYLVKRVVEDQSGKIIFASQENQGSTFGFSLPLTAVPLNQTVPLKDGDEKPVAAAEAIKMAVDDRPVAQDERSLSPPLAAAPKPAKAIRKKYYTIQ